MEAGLAQGTWRNKAVQARRYISYMKLHMPNILWPSQYHIMSYLIEHSDELKSPTSVLNYCSGARTLVRALGGSVARFDTYPISLVCKRIQKLSDHTSATAPPLTPKDVKAAVRLFTSIGDNGPDRLRAALLIGYFTLLRQSNLLTILTLFTSKHAILVRDITEYEGGLIVNIRSSKTFDRSTIPLNIMVPAIRGSPYYPVAAWQSYKRVIQPYPCGLAFVTSDGSPSTQKALRDTLCLALSVEGHSCSGAITLHSIRRGGAQACAQ